MRIQRAEFLMIVIESPSKVPLHHEIPLFLENPALPRALYRSLRESLIGAELSAFSKYAQKGKNEREHLVVLLHKKIVARPAARSLSLSPAPA
jgi:hypothetical protein